MQKTNYVQLTDATGKCENYNRNKEITPAAHHRKETNLMEICYYLRMHIHLHICTFQLLFREEYYYYFVYLTYTAAIVITRCAQISS